VDVFAWSASEDGSPQKSWQWTRPVQQRVENSGRVWYSLEEEIALFSVSK